MQEIEMGISESVKRLLAETEVVVHPDDYTIVSIPRGEDAKARSLMCNLEPFSSVTHDKAEVSVVLKGEDWEDLKGQFGGFLEDGPYRLFSFDIVLDLSVVGFLAAVSDRLAEAGVSIYALSTYLRDHILVKKKDAEKAEETLRNLIEECKQSLSNT